MATRRGGIPHEAASAIRCAGLTLTLTALAVIAVPRAGAAGAPRLSVLTDPSSVTPESLSKWKAEGFRAVALSLPHPASASTAAAGSAVKRAGLGLVYWVEVGRSPEMARKHPEWMASVQTHPEWRRHFPGAPEPGPGEVVKKYPWTPVWYRESQSAHVDRVVEMLAGLPSVDAVFLNSLQAGPSACGCGNLLCQWVADYGDHKTAASLGDEAPALFLRKLRAKLPRLRVIPVWTPECEEADMAAHGACAGVPCYRGACWPAWTRQLMAVAADSEVIGVLALHRKHGRTSSAYGPPGAWVKKAISQFQTMPPARGGKAVEARRLTAVVQGWDLPADEEKEAIASARAAGARSIVVARSPIDTSWQPRVMKLRPLPDAAQGAPAILHGKHAADNDRD